MSETLFANVRVFDGTGASAFAGEVLVRGARIAGVAAGTGGFERAGRTVIDGDGHTLMPGLIEPHAHLTFLSFGGAAGAG